MLIIDYIINLSIFSLMVSTPLVIGSLLKFKPLKHTWFWVSVYGGIVSVILVMLSFQQQGYSYDLRYAPIILVFAYLGPLAGVITAIFSLIMRLFVSGNWTVAIIGWTTIMVVFSVVHIYITRFSAVKKLIILVSSYILIYVITVPIIFNIFRDSLAFHSQYLLFIVLGVIIGTLLIESYLKLYRIISENKRMARILAESESKYRLIAENTSDLILVMNKKHEGSYFSPSHEHILGYATSELEKMELCKITHPDDLELFKENIIKMFENEKLHSMEFRLRHKDGNWIEFESRCMPVKGEGDVIEHIVLISRDISERKKAETILLQSEKLSIVGELAAGVAHEIRNPLTTIKGFIQLYKNDHHSLNNELLLSELARIENITSELLTLGKPQAVQLDKTNVIELIEYTLELLSPQALLKNIQFNLWIEDDDICITCEKNQLKQVLLNILKNAMEAMNGGGDIDITLRKDKKNQCVILFQDQGCGIPEELLPRLGEPFYTMKEKGTGLGLMICNKIIKQHHGTISFKSKVNEGTLIEIRLPLAG
ncbi:ATP-binding protein [Litchfieldia alkalitelluris]|uniref:ATP-binding protein n=1 Tax=Litchfieldia alkalitelluris TaxID=304268 RepID=UPI0009963AAB|nr:ATP-binding protein [Litchfieldia alkalitelluris]